MSPGTTSRGGHLRRSCPSRRTRACGTCIFDSASTLALRLELLARPEDDVEQDEQRDDDRRSATSPMAKLTAATATSMMFIGSRSCSQRDCHTDGGFSPVISFGP